ncbi:uncharacterized protein L969DRAFT_49629 [Mixia osmundae IAM 14324]|uniref:Major facilitator superfamily (MFS) profile domain-containing protein n=1 Tax=Mixia osmundae (strain CBS 9802 / IAM 14324 / JCM 22182 / KY 12970) TaxID=764103 RepID=G7DVX9_MIXOS|nr:uncharacterized protein L969DRAFT_49629 [Mixia osmundae IAM 14324]KEI39580.1 hypothetical protein L969DRAFT_49629 [Mixia osmundae IAM 14324]GAA94739.1 hypothetical protein E5Q_01393 [Mixia osmundae IAM 14324]
MGYGSFDRSHETGTLTARLQGELVKDRSPARSSYGASSEPSTSRRTLDDLDTTDEPDSSSVSPLAFRSRKSPFGSNRSKRKDRPATRPHRSWSRSTERLLFPSARTTPRKDLVSLFGQSRPNRTDDDDLPEHFGDDPFDPDTIEEHEAVMSPMNGRFGLPAALDADYERPYGVAKMELIARRWSKRGLYSVYVGIYLLSFVTSLEWNTTPTVEPYFLSLFQAHSYLSTVSIGTSIAYAVGKPPLAKVLDVFGRAEAVALSAGLYGAGYLLTATAINVEMFGFGRVLAALGSQGLQLAQQIIIADTSTLTNRALLTSTISLPWLITTWIGPALGAAFKELGVVGYRLCYGLFGILLPLICIPLLSTLFTSFRKAKKRAQKRYDQHRPPRSGDDVRFVEATSPTSHSAASAASVRTGKESYMDTFVFRDWRDLSLEVWQQLDVMGIFLITLSCTSLLVPLSLAAARNGGWFDIQLTISLLVGVLSAIGLVWYESNRAVNPILPRRILSHRTIMAGSLLGFFHFFCQFAYESYFTSFLQVSRGHSARDSQYIAQSYMFSACVSALVCGLLTKWTSRWKIFGVIGIAIHAVGAFMMLRYRRLDNPTSELIISQIVAGCGGGFTTLAAQLGVQSVVEHRDVATATAVFLTITQIGGAAGGSLAGGVWTTMLPSRLAHYLPPDSDDLIKQVVGSISVALSFPMGTPERIAISDAYVDVQRVLNTVALLSLLPCLLAVSMMRDTHLTTDDHTLPEGVVVLGRAIPEADEESHSEHSETDSLLYDSPSRRDSIA